MSQSIGPQATPSHITFPRPEEDHKGWGKEIVLINCPDYCSKILCFNAGQDGSLHFHDKKHETWYVLEGNLCFEWLDTSDAEMEMKVLKAGDMVDIPRLCPHKVTAMTDCRILEVSTPHHWDDSFRVAKGASQREIARA